MKLESVDTAQEVVVLPTVLCARIVLGTRLDVHRGAVPWFASLSLIYRLSCDLRLSTCTAVLTIP